jgi:hypothetical protein
MILSLDDGRPALTLSLPTALISLVVFALAKEI